MMSLPPPDDPRKQQDAPASFDSDDRMSRAYEPRPPTDPKTSLEQAFQDAVNGIHLPPSKRFFQGKSFAYGGIQRLAFKFPDDQELMKDLKEIRDGLKAIRPPHPNYTTGISQNMRVLEIKSPRPDTSADIIGENIAPGLVGRMEERDYAEVFDQVLDVVWEVMNLLVERKVFEFEMSELPVEESDGDKPEFLLDDADGEDGDDGGAL